MLLTQCQGRFWQLRQAVESGGATECQNISRYAHNTEKYVAFQQKTSDFDSNKHGWSSPSKPLDLDLSWDRARPVPTYG